MFHLFSFNAGVVFVDTKCEVYVKTFFHTDTHTHTLCLCIYIYYTYQAYIPLFPTSDPERNILYLTAIVLQEKHIQ